MRKVKSPEARRGEILETAQHLFETKGYDRTTINDILSAISIAKGTFYYYYKSKEEVMDAIVLRKIAAQTAEIERLSSDEYLSVNEKIFSILMLLRDTQTAHIGNGQPSNAEMQRKLLGELVKNLGPVIASVINQGKTEGLFATDYPQEVVEQLIVMIKIIFEPSMFSWTAEERTTRARAFASTMESILGAAQGSFNFVAEMLSS
jgi:AcrR family transcriptional regulator